jgi:predicted enzyme related to lactoylglutathione lyase
MGQPVAFFEVTSVDAERARSFYGSLFDWKVAPPDPEMAGYSMVETGGENAIGGGIGVAESDTAGARFYVWVEDLAPVIARAQELGGKELAPPRELPKGFGTIAKIADPDGNEIGLWSS